MEAARFAQRVDPTGLNPLAIPVLCQLDPGLCATAGATIIVAVWNGCYWVYRKAFSGGGGGAGDDDGDECDRQLSEDEADCGRSTKNSAMPGARRACHERSMIRFRICRENQRGASKEMPSRWTEGKDDEVWRNYDR